ncbi:MAG TPA: hypothetical protein VMV09_04955 [Candidatus Saccharimonadales bacterium]|nr:hypothetical protein [Candidatus Saccharimonadales bacterium]
MNATEMGRRGAGLRTPLTGDYRPSDRISLTILNMSAQPSTQFLTRRLFLDFGIYSTCSCS